MAKQSWRQVISLIVIAGTQIFPNQFSDAISVTIVLSDTSPPVLFGSGELSGQLNARCQDA